MSLEQITFTREDSYYEGGEVVINTTIHKVCVFLRYNTETEALEAVALTEGQKIEFSRSGKTDEGSFYENEVFALRNGVLYSEWASGGVDCDGPLHQYGESKATSIDSDGRPIWEDISRGQQDVYAENMGY